MRPAVVRAAVVHALPSGARRAFTGRLATLATGASMVPALLPALLPALVPAIARASGPAGPGGSPGPATVATTAPAFDPSHAAWSALLRRHVVVSDGGSASKVNYRGLAADRGALRDYLGGLSSVGQATFDGWPRADRMAFLINAYNAFTVELILSRYPDLASIRDLGGLFSSPWKNRFVPLLGQRLSLDDIEHGRLRARGRYDDWRIHFAVNCASVGCPMLREEAFVAGRLEAQLDEQERRFMADRRRNRYDPARGQLRVSRIFDWYGDDFRQGHRGVASLPAFFARHADRLADDPADRARLRAGDIPVTFLDYDWALNDAG